MKRLARKSWGLGLWVVSAAALLFACDEEKPAEPAKSAAPAPPPPPPAPAPSASAAPEPEVKADCPEKSEGVGSYDKPCDAKGKLRLMEVQWTGKMGDDGPSFRVKNAAKLPVLYGKMATYFYDKAGKQLMVKEGDKDKPAQWCAGKIFQGPMKVDEKAVITFSCVNKSHVPEGTTAIEAEMVMVGFTDDEAKKTSFYWRNADLAPDERPKGGIKK
ncbi:MAG: hypothetical protein R3B13_05890 [Polyangiaceae bacterium]